MYGTVTALPRHRDSLTVVAVDRYAQQNFLAEDDGATRLYPRVEGVLRAVSFSEQSHVRVQRARRAAVQHARYVSRFPEMDIRSYPNLFSPSSPKTDDASYASKVFTLIRLVRCATLS